MLQEILSFGKRPPRELTERRATRVSQLPWLILVVSAVTDRNIVTGLITTVFESLTLSFASSTKFPDSVDDTIRAYWSPVPSR
jgi:hypothetical protein